MCCPLTKHNGQHNIFLLPFKERNNYGQQQDFEENLASKLKNNSCK
jgi:hypothetical protein